ncbi:neuronal PAS domain-containing protein 1-like [Mercenaria mercenaria]|uniref:neuronal PAS domain-containing protein 1-like n=1 Tax=Mercenaria mercenaria TaxID=6596 RepID=UPI00234F8AA4|nr:neuronal PAS domain-containing protein 1-like [Mercenaria mercenaria]
MAETEEQMEVDHSKGKENVRKLTRGEKSKIAAKGRRDKEHEAMLQLLKELPIEDVILNKMDKAAVVKLATCYLKIKHFVQKDIAIYGHKALTNGSTPKEQTVAALQAKKYENVKEREGQIMLEALNGFLIFVNRKGSIKFVTKTIQDHLGLKQEYLFGKNVFDYIHESDHNELSKQFTEDKKADRQSKSLIVNKGK